MGLLDWIAGKGEYPELKYPRKAVIPDPGSKKGHTEITIKDRVQDVAVNLKHSGNVVYLSKHK